MFLWHEKTRRGRERVEVRVCASVISEVSEGVGEVLSLPKGTVEIRVFFFSCVQRDYLIFFNVKNKFKKTIFFNIIINKNNFKK
jgi:hypothetical protein